MTCLQDSIIDKYVEVDDNLDCSYKCKDDKLTYAGYGLEKDLYDANLEVCKTNK